jgi:LacI family transcriptional regulator
MNTQPPAEKNTPKNHSHTVSAPHGVLAMLWTTDIKPIEQEIGLTIQEAAVEIAEQHGLKVRIASFSPEGPLPDFVLNGEVDGVLVQGSVPSETIVEHLKNLPVVWLLTKGQNNWADRVQPDNYEIGHVCCEHLIQHGHRQIACVTSAYSTDTPAYYERAAAFARCANKHGVPVHFLDETSEHDFPPEERHIRLAERLLALKPSMTGLFIANDNVASLISTLTERGIRIGKDLFIICSNREYAKLCSPDLHLTIVDIHAEIIGREAIKQLLWRMAHRDAPTAVCKRIHARLIDSHEFNKKT